jgi:hypothetical protein
LDLRTLPLLFSSFVCFASAGILYRTSPPPAASDSKRRIAFTRKAETQPPDSVSRLSAKAGDAGAAKKLFEQASVCVVVMSQASFCGDPAGVFRA